jgi:hypothetical protein
MEYAAGHAARRDPRISRCRSDRGLAVPFERDNQVPDRPVFVDLNGAVAEGLSRLVEPYPLKQVIPFSF